MANGDRRPLRDVAERPVLTCVSYVINGFVSEQNIVDQVETWLGDNIMGDMHILARDSGWKDLGGVRLRRRSCRRAGSGPSLKLT